MPVKRTLVMGIGNLLLSDDGVGVHAAKALCEYELPEWVAVLDVGTAFLDSLPALETAERIIIIDAVQADGAPGTIYSMPVDRFAPRQMQGLHDLDIFSMLAMAGNNRPVEVTVLGVEPERIEWGLELSDAVSATLPDLVKAVCEKAGIRTGTN